MASSRPRRFLSLGFLLGLPLLGLAWQLTRPSPAAILAPTSLAQVAAPDRSPAEPASFVTSAAPATIAIVAPAAAPADPLVVPYRHTFGLYVNRQKAGWMAAELTQLPGGQVRLRTTVAAQVGGMGSAQTLTLRESRTYAAGPRGALLAVVFEQRAATGKVRVTGARKGAELALQVTAGGATHRQKVACDETLADVLAAERLARGQVQGARASIRHFDPSLQKQLTMDLLVTGQEVRQMGGVAVPAIQIEERCAELGLVQSSWFDGQGKLLASRMGGFFEMRLEPEEMAKKMGSVQDVLVGAAVPTPEPLRAPESIERLTLTLTGLGDLVPPSAARQTVQRQGAEVTLTLHRQPPLAANLLWPTPVTALPPAVRAELLPTAFIQSTSPVLRQAAERAVAGATDAATAAARLVHFVHQHMHSEYVPAYSNALEAYTSARGDCTEHAVLLAALARAAGIPARVVVGLVYWPPGKGFGWHAWNELWLNGGWVAVDPTWDQVLADPTHITLAEGGPAEQARIAMLLGSLQVARLSVSP